MKWRPKLLTACYDFYQAETSLVLQIGEKFEVDFVALVSDSVQMII